MRRQVGIGEGTRAAAGARRRAESGGRADTAGRGGQVGKRGGRLREVGQHPRPMQAAGAVPSVVCRLSSRRDRLCTLDCAVLWCALAGGRVVDTGLATSVPTRGANVTAKRCWRLSRTRGTWGGRKAATVGVGGCGSAKGGRWWPCRGATETRCCCCCNGLQAQGARGSGRMSRRRGESLSTRPCRR